jgi:hypothetical protein
MARIDRRAFLAGAGALAIAGPAAASAATARPRITMWKDPNCGCCGAWADRVQAAFGAPVQVVPTADMPALKRARGIPEDLWSCHTAMIDGYLVEGHVPPADIQRLIASRNRQVKGLATPGMPMGAPGMEHGSHVQRYQVIAFGPGTRRSVFATHG